MADEQAMPEPLQRLAKASQATHLAIMVLAAAQGALEALRADRNAAPEAIMDAAQEYRRCENEVQQRINNEVAAHLSMDAEDLTSVAGGVKITPEGGPQQ